MIWWDNILVCHNYDPICVIIIHFHPVSSHWVYNMEIIWVDYTWWGQLWDDHDIHDIIMKAAILLFWFFMKDIQQPLKMQTADCHHGDGFVHLQGPPRGAQDGEFKCYKDLPISPPTSVKNSSEYTHMCVYIYIYAYGPKTEVAKRYFFVAEVLDATLTMGWGGVGWGGGC